MAAQRFDTGVSEALNIAMFRREWRLSGHQRPLRSSAVIDVTPDQQHLYAEFVLFEQLFQRHGIAALIAAPDACTLRDGALWHGDTRIDLVYNRLTDFALVQAANATLRQAYLEHAVVLTPHPRAHARYADSRSRRVPSSSG